MGRKAAAKLKKKPAPKAKAKAKAKTTKPTVSDAQARIQAAYQNYWQGGLDRIEKEQNLYSSLDNEYRLSTGVLTIDMVLTGGLGSGWTGFAGFEQSAKSTLAQHILGAAVRTKVPAILYLDPEGSIEPKYAGNITRFKLNEIFGLRNTENTGWSIPPKARYYPDTELEKVFSTIQRTLARMPYKMYRPEKKQWYLVFRRKKRFAGAFKALGGPKAADKDLFRETGMYWVPVPDGSLQALFVIDSIAALVSEKAGEEIVEKDKKPGGQGLGALARHLSEWIPKVKGMLRNRHACLVALNQLRERPMAGPGQRPIYEVGGTAPRSYSDVRNEMSTRAVPEGMPKGTRTTGKKSFPTSAWGEEESVEVEGGIDQYMYKYFQNTKNKKGRPLMECSIRVLTKDAYGNGRGIDPVYDTWQYLSMTGQVQGSRTKKFTTSLTGKHQLDWYTFKCLIYAELYRNADLVKYLAKECKIKEKLGVRRNCFAQIKSGEAFKLMDAYLIAKQSADDEEADVEGDDDF